MLARYTHLHALDVRRKLSYRHGAAMHVCGSKLREAESVAARPPEGQPASDVRPVEVASVPEFARHRPPRTARSGRTQAALALRLSGDACPLPRGPSPVQRTWPDREQD